MSQAYIIIYLCTFITKWNSNKHVENLLNILTIFVIYSINMYSIEINNKYAILLYF